MKKSRAIIGGIQTLALATVITSASAFADTTPAQTTASASQAAPKLSDKITVSYLGTFAGPSIGSPSNYQPNDMGVIDTENQKNRVNLANTLSAGYKLNKDMVLSGNFNFTYYPVGGDKFQLDNPALKLSHSKVLNSGNFNMAGSIRAYAPVTQSSQDKGMITRLRAIQISSLEIPGSRWTLGAFSEQNYYAYSKEQAVNLTAYLGPNLSYQLNKSTAIQFVYELYANHKTAEGLLTWGASDPTDFMFAVSYDITPSINLNPFLMIYPGGVISLDATQFGAYISAKLL